MTRRPDFDDLVGRDAPADERDRLRRVHELLIEAGPPEELSPEMESVPWPEDALAPLFGRRREGKKRRPMLLAATIATALVAGFLLGQATTTSSTTSIDARETVKLQGTSLAPNALATLKLGHPDAAGNWPMVLEVSGLPKLKRGGYYDLYLTKDGRPIVSCGTVNTRGTTVVRLSAAYALEKFDKNGWVIVRKIPPNFQRQDVVLTAAAT
ncbi:MAG: hypothetical protein ACJ734_07060 [Gaiellaceae bacterium]